MMSKKEMTTTADAQVPAFMQEFASEGKELASQYTRPPMLKVIQPLSKGFDDFNKGDAIMLPQRVLVGGVENAFLVTPILFYPQWLCWNPLKLRGVEPSIVSTTTDPNSELAKKCKDRETWVEPHPDPKYANDAEAKVRNCEHLNFLVVIHDHPEISDRIPVLMSFARAGWKNGSNFMSLIQLRVNSPIYGGVYSCKPQEFNNSQGQWWSIVCSNPEGESYITQEEQFNDYQQLHKMYRDLYQKDQIDMTFDPDEEIAEPSEQY